MEKKASLPKSLEEKILKHGQGHLLDYVSTYSPEELADYVAQLNMLNFDQIDQVSSAHTFRSSITISV